MSKNGDTSGKGAPKKAFSVRWSDKTKGQIEEYAERSGITLSAAVNHLVSKGLVVTEAEEVALKKLLRDNDDDRSGRERRVQ